VLLNSGEPHRLKDSTVTSGHTAWRQVGYVYRPSITSDTYCITYDANIMANGRVSVVRCGTLGEAVSFAQKLKY